MIGWSACFGGKLGKSRRRGAQSPSARLAAVEKLEERVLLSTDAILHWNEIALQAVANDHTPSVIPNADQGGPTATARAMAIVHAAMFDAFNSIDGTYDPYLVSVQVPTGASIDAAVGRAAHRTLSELFPSQAEWFDQEFEAWSDEIPNGRAEKQGMRVGRIVANTLLRARRRDGSHVMMTYTPGTGPGHHEVDPLNPDQGFLTPLWGKVKPFAITDVNDYLAPPPPALDSQEYTDAYHEVYELGSIDSATRTDEQTAIGIYWAYDGSPGLGTPPRMYNQIARTIAADMGNTEAENARLFALVNIALGDAGIASWAAKYEYDFWRPIVAIRKADIDGNPDTHATPDWTPLGAPNSNQGGNNFTPPFPAYTSGHATFGAAAFKTIANFYGTDDIAFTFTSDEFNGVTSDWQGNVRPWGSRSFDSLSEAALENAMSRIYLGIHWNFDATEGVNQGNAVADSVFEALMHPRTPQMTRNPVWPNLGPGGEHATEMLPDQTSDLNWPPAAFSNDGDEHNAETHVAQNDSPTSQEFAAAVDTPPTSGTNHGSSVRTGNAPHAGTLPENAVDLDQLFATLPAADGFHEIL